MYAYARNQNLNETGALVAALGYMFAGKWLLHILAGGHYIMIPLAWLPLGLLFLERAINRRSLVAGTWGGVIFSLIILGTHPQMTLYTVFFTAIWTLVAVFERPIAGSDGRARLALLCNWAIVGFWSGLVGMAL